VTNGKRSFFPPWKRNIWFADYKAIGSWSILRAHTSCAGALAELLLTLGWGLGAFWWGRENFFAVLVRQFCPFCFGLRRISAFRVYEL